MILRIRIRPRIIAAVCAVLVTITVSHAQSLDTSFNPGANGEIRALAVQADGKILVGGEFTTLGGGGTGTTSRSHIGRLNIDGSLDTTFNPGANGTVWALVVQPDGKILIGGEFTGLGGSVNTGFTPRNHIGRINVDGSLDTSFNPGANDTVFALALQSDGKIVVGGDFDQLGGPGVAFDRFHIGRLSPAGGLDGFNPGANGRVWTLAVEADGKVLVGGEFTSLGGGEFPFSGPTRFFMGRLNTDGSPDNFGAGDGANARVLTLAVQTDQSVLVGGDFTTLGFGGGLVGTAPRNHIGRFNANDSLDTSFNPGAGGDAGFDVNALQIQADGKILVGGFFWSLGGGTGTTTRNYIGRINADGSLDVNFDPGANGPVDAFAVQANGMILVTGNFTSLGGGGTGTTTRNYIGRLNNSVAPALTPPIVTTAAANGLAQTSATLNGTINPNGKSTTGYFQWGLTSPAYGNTTTSQTMGSGTSAVSLNQGLTSLACNTLYHFRAVGTNGDGTRDGSDLTFTTSACPVTAITVSGVSPPSGSTDGGTQVTVSGTGFIVGASVTFGGAAATSVSVTISSTITCNTPAHSAGGVTVQVTNPNSQSGQLSSAFTYTSAAPTLPVITTQPSNQTVTAGTNATFTVAASGAPTPTLQWQVSTNAGATWTNLTNASPSSGVTTSVLTVSNVPSSLNGEQFRCVATNSAGAATSAAATLTVTVSVGGLFAQQGPKLVGTGAVGFAAQGESVSLSADGNTAIIGGDGDNGSAGAAWVWTKSGSAWKQQGTKLVGFGAAAPTSKQGTSVSLSADGNTAIVGGSNDTGTWVWTRSGDVWFQQGSKLIPSGVPGFGFAGQGTSVSLSADGNTAIVGGPTDDNTNFTGAAWVWTRNSGIWSQQGSKLYGSGAVGRFVRQGASVALSADGNTAIVGGPGDNGGAGAAWIWTRSGGVWTQQGAKLVGSGSQQGHSVALSADGNTAIVGGSGSGALIWTRSGGVWTQQGSNLLGSGGTVTVEIQGYSVALSADGNTALVGGFTDGSLTAAAWVWKRNGGVWTQQPSMLVGSDAIGVTSPGVSVSLSADGNTAIIGGPSDQPSGAAWVFAAGANSAVPPRRRAVGH